MISKIASARARARILAESFVFKKSDACALFILRAIMLVALQYIFTRDCVFTETQTFRVGIVVVAVRAMPVICAIVVIAIRVVVAIGRAVAHLLTSI